ncbi:MAG: NAD-dependent epimerase/dehydratase family protein [Clostridiales bacterium]|nr:NAD-dependent epimerase/dehydratase family protein [Clostridiales bacterium]
MKILITGEGGYIGSSLADFLRKFGYEVTRLGLKGENSEYLTNISCHAESAGENNNERFKKALTGVDAVIHAAAMAHKSENRNSVWERWEAANTALTVSFASLCKKCGVKHFVFLSTMSVFEGKEFIDSKTEAFAQGFYGKSKLLAEQKLSTFAEDNFKVAIIRPPMVYGKNCPGNFKRLKKLAKYTPVFPKCENRRSMIYIGHLVNFIKIILDNNLTGVFHPQNREYVCTSEMVRLIRKAYGKKTLLLSGFGFLRGIKTGAAGKLFSDALYSRDIDNFPYEYRDTEFEESIRLSVL